jgi:hypothetical protein
MDVDVAQTSRLRLRKYRSDQVEKQPGQDGARESLELRSSPNKRENAFQAPSGAEPK